jgi:branched-chain amino acid transport system permease protein
MFKAKKIALGILILLLIALPRWVNPYVLQILILTITYSMLGLAFSFTLRVGLPRFDIAAWWGVGAYATALLMKKAGMSFWPTVLIGGLIAVFLGWFVFKIAIPRGMIVFLMFGMVTAMAMQQIFGSIGFFGGWGGTGLVPRPTIGSFKFIRKPELYYLGLFFLTLTVVVCHLLYNSRIGRAWNAIGSSLRLASSVGVDVVKYRMVNVLIGNFLLAMAGSYYIAYSLNAVPSTFSFHNSVYVMMYAVVGGLFHSLSGPIIGAAIITFIPEYFRVAKEYEPIITSAAIILMIIFMPMGIMGLIDQRIKPWFFRKKWYTGLSGEAKNDGERKK